MFIHSYVDKYKLLQMSIYADAIISLSISHSYTDYSKHGFAPGLNRGPGAPRALGLQMCFRITVLECCMYLWRVAHWGLGYLEQLVAHRHLQLPDKQWSHSRGPAHF